PPKGISDTGDRVLSETGNRKPETGNRKSEIGNRDMRAASAISGTRLATLMAGKHEQNHDRRHRILFSPVFAHTVFTRCHRTAFGYPRARSVAAGGREHALASAWRFRCGGGEDRTPRRRSVARLARWRRRTLLESLQPQQDVGCPRTTASGGESG